ncbi:unnamed protein product, partial [Polarella glacialis]
AVLRVADGPLLPRAKAAPSSDFGALDEASSSCSSTCEAPSPGDTESALEREPDWFPGDLLPSPHYTSKIERRDYSAEALERRSALRAQAAEERLVAKESRFDRLSLLRVRSVVCSELDASPPSGRQGLTLCHEEDLSENEEVPFESAIETARWRRAQIQPLRPSSPQQPQQNPSLQPQQMPPQLPQQDTPQQPKQMPTQLPQQDTLQQGQKPSLQQPPQSLPQQPQQSLLQQQQQQQSPLQQPLQHLRNLLQQHQRPPLQLPQQHLPQQDQQNQPQQSSPLEQPQRHQQHQQQQQQQQHRQQTPPPRSSPLQQPQQHPLQQPRPLQQPQPQQQQQQQQSLAARDADQQGLLMH